MHPPAVRLKKVWKIRVCKRSVAMKAPVGLLSDGAVLRSKMEGLCPDKFRHDAQNADNARKNTAFPPVCKKCAKVCRAPESGKSHEESYDSSWDFGALEGTRIPGPLIKSQMLYRLSYERIFCGKTIPPNNITTIGCKKQERHLKKRKFQFYTSKLLKKPLRPALQQLHQQAGIDADHRGRLAQIHGLALGQVG